jgi:hypothetical protein
MKHSWKTMTTRTMTTRTLAYLVLLLGSSASMHLSASHDFTLLPSKFTPTTSAIYHNDEQRAGLSLLSFISNDVTLNQSFKQQNFGNNLLVKMLINNSKANFPELSASRSKFNIFEFTTLFSDQLQYWFASLIHWPQNEPKSQQVETITQAPIATTCSTSK